MKAGTHRCLLIGTGLCLVAVILARHGFNWPGLVAAIVCVFGAVWIVKQLGLARSTDCGTEYELDLLARLDDPDPFVRKQAEKERDLRAWQRFHGARGTS
jgi:hypothetical protein